MLLVTRKTTKRAFAILTIVILSMTSNKALAYSGNYLNSWESGTLNFWEDVFTVGITYEFFWVGRSLKNFRTPNRKWSQQDAITYRRRSCDLLKSWKRAVRDWDAKFAYSGLTIYGPNAFAPYVSRIAETINFTRNLRPNRKCTDTEQSDLDNLVNLTANVFDAKKSVRKLKKKRRLAKSWENTFSLELYPIPIRVEFLKGSLKLRLSGSYGPLRGAFLSGPTLSSDKKSGIKMLVFISVDKDAYMFDVDGQHFDLMLPKSTLLEFRGDIVYVACPVECANGLKIQQ